MKQNGPFQMENATRYLVTVGRYNSLPPYLFCKLLLEKGIDAQSVSLLASKDDSVREASTICSVLRQQLPTEIVEDPYDPGLIHSFAQRYRGCKAIHLHYTGGTAAMAVGLTRAFQSADLKLETSYIDPVFHRLHGAPELGVQGDLRKLDTLTLDVASLIKLHGMTPQKGKNISDDQLLSRSRSLVEYFFENPEVAKLYGEIHDTVQKQKKPTAIAIPESLEKVRAWLRQHPEFPIDALDTVGLRGEISRRTWDSAARCFRYEFFEHYVYLAAREVPKSLNGSSHRIEHSVEWTYQGRQCELDIAVVLGYQLIGISCSWTNDPSLALLKAYEVSYRVRQAGGDAAKGIVVCLVDPSAEDELNEKLKRNTGSDMGQVEIWAMPKSSPSERFDKLKDCFNSYFGKLLQVQPPAEAPQVDAASGPEHLLITVGTNPLPALIAGKALLKDRQLTLLHSEKTKLEAERVAQALGRQPLSVSVEPFSPELVRSAIRNWAQNVMQDADLHVHYTGGTKPMAVETVRELATGRRELDTSYLAAGRNTLYSEHRTEIVDTRKRYTLTLDELWKLHGYEPQATNGALDAALAPASGGVSRAGKVYVLGPFEFCIVLGHQLVLFIAPPEERHKLHRCKHKAFDWLYLARQMGGEDARVVLLTELSPQDVKSIKNDLPFHDPSPIHVWGTPWEAQIETYFRELNWSLAALETAKPKGAGL